jgi:hypothetical protein
VNSNNYLISKPRAWPLGPLGPLGPLAGVCVLAFTSSQMSAQEALRGSIAGDSQAASLQTAQTTLGYYNILLGPTALRFSSALSATYNDNVYDSSRNMEGDLILAPSVDTQFHWPVSLRNSLDVGINVGYSEYLVHSSLSQFFITPGSGFSFDVYVGNIKINLHDRASISQYGYQDPGAGSDQNLVSLQNTVGVSASMDLDKGEVGIGYDHNNYASLTQTQSQPASSSDSVFANAGFRVEPQILVGVEASGSLITGGQADTATTTTTTTNSTPALLTPSAIQYSAGVFASAQISEYLSARLDVGYSIYDDTGQGSGVSANGSGFDFTASVIHRVNKWLNYTFAAGRSTDLAAYGQAQNRLYAQLNPSWNLINKYSLNTPIAWQQGSAVTTLANANDSDNYNQYSIGVNIGRSLSKKLSGSISYQFVDESGTGGAASYTAMIISLSFNYQF